MRMSSPTHHMKIMKELWVLEAPTQLLSSTEPMQNQLADLMGTLFKTLMIMTMLFL
jgi:hypothetical protein